MTEPTESKNVLKQREHLYRLIIRFVLGSNSEMHI